MLNINAVVSSIISGFLHILIVYFMTNNFCGFNASIALKKIKIIPAISILTTYTIFHTLSLLILHDSIHQALKFFILLILTWVFVEKKKISFSLDEIALIWLLIYALNFLLFVPIPLIIGTFTTNTLIIASLTFIPASISTVILCQKLDFNRLLIFILRRTTLRILIFLAVMLFLVSSSIFNHHSRAFLEHSLIILTFFVPALIGLLYTIRLTHQSTAVVPEAYHDAKKLLMLLDIRAEEATDFSKLNEMLAQSVDLMDLKLPGSDPTDSTTVSANFEKFLERTIESMKMGKKSNVKVISNIQFSDKYGEVNDIKLAYMTGLLLEYALDTLTKRPIFVDITSLKHHAQIRVSCEYKFEKSLEHLENFLLDNEIVHSKVKDNFSLSKLKSIVDSHNGKSVITNEKNNQEQVDYLSICISFGKEGDSLE